MAKKNYQTELECAACYEDSLQRCFHHLKTRKSGGSEGKHNLLPVCSSCHNSVHALGLKKFSREYPAVAYWLKRNGWEYIEWADKWVHPLET